VMDNTWLGDWDFADPHRGSRDALDRWTRRRRGARYMLDSFPPLDLSERVRLMLMYTSFHRTGQPRRWVIC
jgi:hypothetical protein